MANSAFTVDGVAAAGSGTLTSVTATAPIVATPSPITTSGNMSLAAAAVTPGNYTSANITVDAFGLIQAASNGTGAGTSFQQINMRVFTSSGTYTPTAFMQYCVIQCLGGGGAGGGAPVTLVSPLQTSAGSGGGAGEYAVGVFSAAAIGVSQAITIGAGGIGISGANGGDGGNTSVGILISANGGKGGTALAATANASIAQGALGGTGGAGGSIRTPGAPGLWGLTFSGGGVALGGQGGSSQFGAGGVFLNNTNGAAGLGYGAGGAGAEAASGFGSFAGGNGSPGVIIITEYIS